MAWHGMAWHGMDMGMGMDMDMDLDLDLDMDMDMDMDMDLPHRVSMGPTKEKWNPWVPIAIGQNGSLVPSRLADCHPETSG